MMELDPQEFGLSPKVKLIELDRLHWAIVKRVKSRIIQKDAEKIIQNVQAIKRLMPTLRISLICHNNICSKSIALLQLNGIEVMLDEHQFD